MLIRPIRPDEDPAEMYQASELELMVKIEVRANDNCNLNLYFLDGKSITVLFTVVKPGLYDRVKMFIKPLGMGVEVVAQMIECMDATHAKNTAEDDVLDAEELVDLWEQE